MILFHKVLDLDQIRILTSIESETSANGSKKIIKNTLYQCWFWSLQKSSSQSSGSRIDESMNYFGSENRSWSKLRIFTVCPCQFKSIAPTITNRTVLKSIEPDVYVVYSYVYVYVAVIEKDDCEFISMVNVFFFL